MEQYLRIIFVIYLVVIAFRYWLDYLNFSHLKKHGTEIPPEFEGRIDRSLLNKTRDYIVDNTFFSVISSLFHNTVFLVFLFGGLLNRYNTWIASLNQPFIISGLIFFLLLFYADTVLTVPFNIYRTFKIEKKYGFNTMTAKIWITDFAKSMIISSLLTAGVISAGLFIVRKSPDLWWLRVWCFFLAFGIFMMYISPYVIEPLFNKFTPVDDENLESGIYHLMQKAGIKVNRVLKMDASKRTKHTNAYFTGIGKVKRIVLFDTLLALMNTNEILAVLAHEAGHWKKKHLLKYIIVTECIALGTLYASFRILRGNFLITLFELDEPTFFAKTVVLGFLLSIAAFPFTPLMNYLSRRHETEADRFSYKLTGDAGGMQSALIKLSKDNLSNLHPHPVYASFHYSHPPILERIRRIQETANGSR